jgi:hypothetical protein
MPTAHGRRQFHGRERVADLRPRASRRSESDLLGTPVGPGDQCEQSRRARVEMKRRDARDGRRGALKSATEQKSIVTCTSDISVSG